MLAKKSAFWSQCWILLWLLSGCVYRFTNEALKAPDGINSIAIEAIYDTTREVLPHEQLWSELQRAFITNGKLKVLSAERADALLRVHLQSASMSHSSPRSGNEAKELKEPSSANRGKALFPSEFRDLSRSRRYAEKTSIAFKALVEIWDLNRNQIIFEKVYYESATTRALRQGTVEAQFIMFEETQEANIKQGMQRMAESVVNDFLL